MKENVNRIKNRILFIWPGNDGKLLIWTTHSFTHDGDDGEVCSSKDPEPIA